MEFVLIPGGRFNLGKPSEESNSVVKAVILKPFLLSRTMMSQGVFYDYAGYHHAGYKRFNKTQRNRRITRRHSEITVWLQNFGDGFRFPSEAEWEYASRAGTTSKYFWGNHYNHKFQIKGSSVFESIKLKKWNQFGLVDMIGARQFCGDGWYSSHEGALRWGVARPPNGKKTWVLKGWDRVPCSRRKPEGSPNGFGFRVARDI